MKFSNLLLLCMIIFILMNVYQLFGQNYALQFDGVDDYLDMGFGINLANSSMTLEAWAKRSAIGESHIILGQGNASTNQGLHVGFRSCHRANL